VSPIQVAALAIRLFAIWLAIYWARWIPYLYSEARKPDDAAGLVVAVGVTLLTVFLVIFLWFFPRTVARTLLPAGESASRPPVSPDLWFAIGCALLGLWVLTDAIPSLVQNVFALFYAQRAQMPRPDGWDAAFLYYLAEVTIGVWLLLGASGARRLFWWARGAGSS